MIPDLVRDFAKQLAHGFALRARRQSMTADEMRQLEAWAMARLAENDYELLRTTKLSASSVLVERLLVEYRRLPVARSSARAIEIEGRISVRVKCVDVDVGCATFDRAIGLAHTILQPSAEYEMIAPFAREIGEWIAVRHYSAPEDGDVADIIGELWQGDRLSLEDLLGRQLALNHVIVAERRNKSNNAPLIQLIADFRADHARVPAVVRPGGLGSGGRARPVG